MENLFSQIFCLETVADLTDETTKRIENLREAANISLLERIIDCFDDLKYDVNTLLQLLLPHWATFIIGEYHIIILTQN